MKFPQKRKEGREERRKTRDLNKYISIHTVYVYVNFFLLFLLNIQKNLTACFRGDYDGATKRL
jgi:hypothetical protein